MTHPELERFLRLRREVRRRGYMFDDIGRPWKIPDDLADIYDELYPPPADDQPTSPSVHVGPRYAEAEAKCGPCADGQFCVDHPNELTRRQAEELAVDRAQTAADIHAKGLWPG